MAGGRLSVPSGGWPDGNHEIDGRSTPDVSDAVFLLASGKAGGPGAQSVFLPLEGKLHGSLPDQPELTVFVNMRRMRRGSRLEHRLMGLNLFSRWGLTFDDFPELGVAALALGDRQILEPECNRRQRSSVGK